MSDHYFSADPAVPFAREPFSCEVWGQRLELVSGSGVYSRGRLDIGTSVLFRETEPPPPGHVLDLGTGYGVIGLAIAAAWRADGVPAGGSYGVTGVEVNQRAVLRERTALVAALYAGGAEVIEADWKGVKA